MVPPRMAKKCGLSVVICISHGHRLVSGIVKSSEPPSLKGTTQKKNSGEPWLAWLSWLESHPITKRLWVRFLMLLSLINVFLSPVLSV